MGKYLDSVGLSHFMSLIKQALAGKSDTGHTHAASDVTSGTFATARIPSLDASKISSGTFDSGRLPTVPATKGGTGETTLKNSANALINALDAGTSNITDDDTYIITENTNATEDKYYRRPVSKLWSYIKGKADALYATISHTHDVATQSAKGFMSASDKTKLDTTLAYDSSVTRVRGKGELTSILLDADGNVQLYEVKTATSDSWTRTGYSAINSSDPRSSGQKAANKVLATPSSSSGVPSMRALVDADMPVIQPAHGGTGETSLGASMDALVGALSTATETPTDDTYIIAESNTTSGTFRRKKCSTLWSYIKGKTDSLYSRVGHIHSNATTSVAGFMSSSDKTKLDDLDTKVGSLGGFYSGYNSEGKSVPNAASATSGTGTQLTGIELPVGTWVIYGHWVFATNATGNRWGAISTTSGSVTPTYDRLGSFRVAACSGAPTVMNAATFVNVTTPTTYNMNAAQNSGGALTVTYYMRAVRIA